ACCSWDWFFTGFCVPEAGGEDGLDVSERFASVGRLADASCDVAELLQAVIDIASNKTPMTV
ncbi:hypothetical protein, partial [Nostoc sp.]